MLRERLYYIARLLSLAVLVGVAGILVIAFIKRGSRIQPPPSVDKGKSRLSEKVVAITEGYDYSRNEQGRLQFRLMAARDISYADGHHELEKMTLITFDPNGGERGRIVADQAVYQPDKDEVAFTGHVAANDATGLEVRSEALTYHRESGVANS